MEQALIDKLQLFLLELGKGFAFVSRQQRITVEGIHYYCDLVLFNYSLNCFCLIDLKIGRLKPSDTGNLRFYVNYWDDHEKLEHHNPSMGIVLCTEKSDAVVKYTLGDSENSLFAARYKTYLPSEEELQRELLKEKSLFEQNETNV